MPVPVRDLDPVERGPFAVARYTLSGAASLAFAFVVATMLSAHLGDTSGIHAATIGALALGFALGGRVEHGPHAWLRPALVGLLAIVVSAVLPGFTALAVGGHLPSSGGGRALLTALLALGAGAVTGLVFASADHSVRSRTAWLAGGAVGIVAIEVVVARRIGVQGALLSIAFTAFVPCVRSRALRAPIHGSVLMEARGGRAEPPSDGARGPWLEAGAGLTLGLFLEVARPIARSVMGPAHENWAALAGGVALALAIGTAVGTRLRVTRARVFFGAALASATGTLFATDLFERTVRAWQASTDTYTRGLVKLAFLFVLVAPTIIALGAGAFARSRSRHAVAHVALGMGVGMLAFRYALQPVVPLAILAGAVAVGAALTGFLATRRFRRLDAGALLGLSALLVVGAARFPERALADGTLDAAAMPAGDSTVIRTETFRRGGAELALLRDSHGIERVRGDGHDDPVVADGVALSGELVSGVMPALYTHKHDRAFVFGGAGGTAAGAAARVFRDVVVVDPNSAAREVLERLGPYNFDVARRGNVTLLTDADPFVVLAATDARFDAIVSAEPAFRDVAASKVATTEFLRLAHARLAPGGVVALSIDDRLPLSGLAIFLRTISDAFAECHFVFLEPERYEVICSDRLAPTATTGAWPPDVLAALAPLTAELGSDRFLEALILAPKQFHGDWFPAPNTFDLPVLEHVMAREDNHRNTWDIDLAVHFDLAAAMLSGDRFDGPRLFERCFALGLMGAGHTLPRCQTLLHAAAGRTLGRRGFPFPAGFLELSVAAASRDARALLSGATLLDELVYAGQEDRARSLIATRSRNGTLTATEETYARRRGLLD